jgi:small-conductance mechanosensitive channel
VEERAQRISARLETIARNQGIPVEAIARSETEFGPTIFVEDILIMTISAEDVAGTNLTPQALAEQNLAIIQAQIQNYRVERSPEYLSRAVAIAVLYTLGLMSAILVLANGMPQFYRWLDRQQDRWIPNIRIQNFELLTASQLTTLVQGFTKLLHFVLVSALVLFYLSTVLSLFPPTRSLGQSVFSHFGSAVQAVVNGFIAYLPNLLSISIVFFLSSSVLRFTRWIFANIQRGRLTISGFYPEWASPTYRLVQFLLVATTLAIIFPYLPGSSSPAFQGVSIFFGLLVSLGAGGVILSVVAGFILVYTRAFREGDRIRFGEIEGFVSEKSLFVTRIRTIENILVSIPNAALLTNNITNYSALLREQQTPIILKTTLTLGYDVPWKLVYDTLIAAAAATDYILKEPQPHVWQTSLDDFYVSYQLRAYTTHPEMLEAIYSDLHQNLQDYCNQAGIEIMSPHYGAMRDGNQTTIPAHYLPDHYQTPLWNVPSARPPAANETSPDAH